MHSESAPLLVAAQEIKIPPFHWGTSLAAPAPSQILVWGSKFVTSCPGRVGRRERRKEGGNEGGNEGGSEATEYKSYKFSIENGRRRRRWRRRRRGV